MATDLETTADRSASLPPRAAIALLSLQLRAAQQEADAAEAALGPDPTDAAVDELRAKLLPRLEQRRVELDAEFERAQQEAAEAVAAARAEASARLEAELTEMLSAEPEPLDVVLDDLPAPVPVVTDFGGMVFWPTPDVAAADDVLVEVMPVEEVIEVEPGPLSIPIITELDPPRPPSPFAAPPVGTAFAPPVGTAVAVPGPNLVDADAFARAIASVLAAVLAERGVAPQQTTMQQPMQQPYYLPYPPQQAPAKAGFWSNAKHIDVLLLFVAMVIVLVILVAWLA